MPFLMAAIYDPLMRSVEAAGMADRRRELLAPLTGTVLESGAGTGRNLEHYPATLDRLVLTEPDRFMRAKLEAAAGHRGPGCPTEIVDAPAERLPFPDGSFDAVVGTLVLCSVSDPRSCLAEIHRVLRPGGRLVFVEHVAADDRPGLHRWQQRLEPVWKRIAGGCHLTRPTERLIREAGFSTDAVEHGTMHKAPPLVRPLIAGSAVRP